VYKKKWKQYWNKTGNNYNSTKRNSNNETTAGTTTLDFFI
jgi:hypothetical protein